MKQSTTIHKYFDGRGNIGELESYPDGMAVARLMRPGGSNATVGVSADGRVGVLHYQGRNPDVLYDRFDGAQQDAETWLESMGFSCPQAPEVASTPLGTRS